MKQRSQSFMATFLTKFSTVDLNIRGEGLPSGFALILTLPRRDEAFASKFQELDANCGIVVPPLLTFIQETAPPKDVSSSVGVLQGATNLSE